MPYQAKFDDGLGWVGWRLLWVGLGWVQKFWVGLGFEKVTHNQLWSGVALIMRHIHSGLSTYVLKWAPSKLHCDRHTFTITSAQLTGEKKSSHTKAMWTTDLRIVRGLFDDFGRHPERRSDECLSLAGRVGQLAGHAEVRQFHVARLRQQNIRRWNQQPQNSWTGIVFLHSVSSARRRVDYKLALLVYKSLHGLAPLYLADDCILVRRRLRSADVDTCIVPRTRTRFGDRSFSATGPRIWNSLPPDLRRPDIELDEFRRLLKTIPFV